MSEPTTRSKDSKFPEETRRTGRPPAGLDGAHAEAPAERRGGRAAAAKVEELTAPKLQAVLETALQVGRAVSSDMHDDEIVHVYVDALKNLLPGRFFAVRLFASESGELVVVYATGRLRREDRDCLNLSREAIEQYRVDLSKTGSIKVKTVDQYAPLFQGGALGFDVPILDGDRLLGALSVEYREAVRPPAEDKPLIGQLVLELSAALQNAGLRRQSTSIRELPSRFVDNANAPIIVVGNLGQVRYANRAFLNLLSLSREEAVGQDWLGMLPESERRSLLPTFINALRGDANSSAEFNLSRRDGRSVRMSARTASIMSADGEVEGVIFIFRDVSGENPVALRQLVAGVVHEINNPLTNISVYGEYLLKKSKDKGVELGDVEKLQRIVASSDRIRNFTRDLVAYARPSTEKPVLCSICEVVDQALGYCEHLIEETGARVERSYEDGLSPVFCVKSQLVQVFVNLITNACQAMPTDVGLLAIEVKPYFDNKVCVRVIDSGTGIPESNLDRIFEPFFTTKGQGKGTGLGLSIVKNIVEQHRGTISVKSEVGAGTTFEIILPSRPDSLGE